MTPELERELLAAWDAKHAARKAYDAAAEAEAEAKSTTRKARDVWKKACERVEEIEEEGRTGSTGRPLLDAVRAAPAPAPAEPGSFTGAQLQEEIRRACVSSGRPDRWGEMATAGAFDVEILGHLRELWAGEGHFFDRPEGSGRLGFTRHVSASRGPQFWAGPRRKENLHAPTLEGADLATAVRNALRIPVPIPTAEPPRVVPPSKADHAPIRRAKGAAPRAAGVAS